MLKETELGVTADECETSISETLTHSGLFDDHYYISHNRLQIEDLNEGSSAAHYISSGEKRGLKPNPLFDPIWYRKRYNLDEASSSALLHYITVGERRGNKPCPYFEPSWYGRTYNIDPNAGSCLAHYLQYRVANNVNPNKFFDVDYYLAKYPEVRTAPVDAFTHWIHWGIFENRRGSRVFNQEFVWSRYLGHQRNLNPFECFMEYGETLGWEGVASPRDDVFRTIEANCAAGPHFETFAPQLGSRPETPKVVAFYLPQFHAIPENDRWWGAGFTEWRNLPRGLPRFEGHIQPRIPRDLGFYNLEGGATLLRQVELARRSGIHGFCFYYYNFNGRRLLERPVETFLSQSDIEFPFCIMWANENWSRRWDGSEQDVLIRQDYRPEDLPALIDDVARHMKDPRYMRSADGRPFFYIYRADVIPNARETIAAWRERFRSAHDLDPIIVMSQSFAVEDPRPLGFDGAIEFPPHKLGADIPLLNASVRMLDADFQGIVRDYAGVVQASMAACDQPFPLVKTAFPSWDNSARRQSHATVFANSSPAAFQSWLTKLLNNALDAKVFGESLVFVNAWNEWAEGAYLEPDTHYGYAYLNAVGRALESLKADARQIVLIGHDAFPAGAQHLLLNLGSIFARGFGMDVRFVLIGGGAMAARYRELAATFIASEETDPWQALRSHLTELRTQGFRRALTNTAAAGGATSILEDLGFSFCSLIHELPTLISSSALEPAYSEILKRARAIVYPSNYVKSKLDQAFGAAPKPTIVRPQGLYHVPSAPSDARASVRSELGLGAHDKIVINVGYGDLRKGVDLFVGLAEQTAGLDKDIQFVWVGDTHPDVRPWIDLDMQRRGLRNIHFKSFTSDVGRYLGAADLLLLTSREDPFPSVVLEALATGLPVAAFENSGGHVELISSDPRLGALLPSGVGLDSARRIVDLLNDVEAHSQSVAAFRRELVATQFDFASYASDLIRLVEPQYRTVSVIVPNYNYAQYLEERLRSIFEQKYPVLEIIVLDDASTDESVAVARKVAQDTDRIISVYPRASNSGNAFIQWKAGLDMARGEFIWIAESDDSSDPRFLNETLRRLIDQPSAVFCFTDSRSIDAGSAEVYDSYKGYYKKFGDAGLEQSGLFRGDEFLRRFLIARNLIMNASSVLWRADALREVFDRLEQEEQQLRCAGDWRIYIEACLLNRTIAYESRPLNIHRRHDNSITSALSKPSHLSEIQYVQKVALAIVDNHDELSQQASRVIDELKDLWGDELAENLGAPSDLTAIADEVIGIGEIGESKFIPTKRYEHFTVELSHLRWKGNIWKHVRYKIIKTGERARFEFRFHEGWTNYLPDLDGMRTDDYGNFLILEKDDIIKIVEDADEASANAFVLALVTATPRIVRVLTRRAGFADDVRTEWDRIFSALRDEAGQRIGMKADDSSKSLIEETATPSD